MEKEYWLKKWQSNDIAFHELKITPDLIAYLPKLNLHKGNYILVPLCGKTKDMLWLADQGFHVVGIELSSIACSDFFTELNVTPQITKQAKFTKYEYSNIELLCGDLFDLSNSDLPTIHAVYDCKALIALPSNIRKKYVDHLIYCLGTDIKIILLTRETSCKVIPPPYSVDDTEINLLYGHYFSRVNQIKRASISDIHERLIKKGYGDMIESVYIISQK
jgi:thiopurine S-methyltransferase